MPNSSSSVGVRHQCFQTRREWQCHRTTQDVVDQMSGEGFDVSIVHGHGAKILFGSGTAPLSAMFQVADCLVITVGRDFVLLYQQLDLGAQRFKLAERKQTVARGKTKGCQ